MRYIDDLCERRKSLEPIKYDIVRAYEMIRDCFKSGNKLLICGNGGSAADSAHITGELMKGFKKKRTIDEKLEKSLLKSIEDYLDKNSDFSSNAKLDEMKKNLEQGLPTIDLTSFVGLNTAYANDKNAFSINFISFMKIRKKKSFSTVLFDPISIIIYSKCKNWT